MSSVNTQEENASTDPRNSNFFKIKKSGTSMASPQVAGIIACALETYPNMTQTQALSYIQNYANNGALLDAPFDTRWESNLYKNFNILHNSPNKYATYQPNTRPNQVQPAIGHNFRPQTGGVYPRARVKRTL
jgi:subtilisin family serine protease